jgi:Ca-activated chloride channel family protein
MFGIRRRSFPCRTEKYWQPPAKPFSLGICVLLASLLGITTSNAQDSLNQVHIVPRIAASEFSPPAIEVTGYASAQPIKVNVDLVLVPVTVTDPMDRIVRGLDREDFEILDGKSRQEIKHFSKQDAPISVGIILDSSGSMRAKIERAREAVTAFLRTGNPEDECFLIAFCRPPGRNRELWRLHRGYAVAAGDECSQWAHRLAGRGLPGPH